ncbi:MAG TPA: hypothetical protein VGA19_07315 [Rhodospirillales bacterium]|jgi:hypothetical protein
MNAVTRTLKNEERNELWNSPLLWSTVALYSIAVLVFFWTDFTRIAAWVGA